MMTFRSACFVGIFLVGSVSTAYAQQSLTLQQQCTNRIQELVLADIAHQEARARCGNIIRQAYELEVEVKGLKDENAKLKEEISMLKRSLREATEKVEEP